MHLPIFYIEYSTVYTYYIYIHVYTHLSADLTYLPGLGLQTRRSQRLRHR